MAAETVNAETAPAPTAVGGESWTALAAWAADELGVRVAFDGKVYRVEAIDEATDPEPPVGESSLRRSWFRRRQSKADAAGPDPEPIEPFTTTTPADLLQELVQRLVERPGVTHARPVSQPTAVHDLSARLFSAYQLDGGQAHLAGCHFDDVPLVRLTWIKLADDGSQQVTHRFFDELGAPVDWGKVQRLGVDRIAPIGEPAPRIDEARLDRMTDSAKRAAGGEADPPALVTIVWAKRAWGRLRFEFGDKSIDAPFDGWAQTLTAPAVVCPQTGVETFHLATDSEGEIAAAEELATCCVSGERRVRSRLGQCVATGQWADAEHLSDCPITAASVLTTKRVRCRLCDQQVSPTACPEGVCTACRNKERVGQGDPRLQRLFEKYPKMRRWGGWRVAETDAALLVEASRLLRSVQWTFDKATLELLHAVATPRLASSWRPLDREQRERLLR
ncbi:hypothetical protein Pla108_25770 [Botrimarina colliarenosi]|uniref:Uncharacterized protein n=1 Tax=Botrimarina colliarenosi TaxID=2528001 RepID=A0A5C6AF01_9BACT|nr:hypothetical protein [Botrimarina colliarenosi]TWT96803.1 hypothetical protein Pla108_25770 [Botrimarina colliarenosi]